MMAFVSHDLVATLPFQLTLNICPLPSALPPLSQKVYLLYFSIVGMRTQFEHVSFGVFNCSVLVACFKTIALQLGFLAPDLIFGLLGVVAAVDVLYPTSGALQARDDIIWPFRLLVYMNPLHYAVENEMLNQYEDREIVLVSSVNVCAIFDAERGLEIRLCSRWFLASMMQVCKSKYTNQVD